MDGERTPAERGGSKYDDDDLLDRFNRWDVDLTAHWSEWMEDAKSWYGFVAGQQWTDEERSEMEEAEKIPVTFNLVDPVISAVQGAEIQDRKQVQYYPRTYDPQDTAIGDVLTQGAEYVTDTCNGDQEDSEAFWDTLICGVGWTEMRVEVEGSDVSLIKERVDPIQMKADPCSRKRCFEDARFVKREIPMSDDEFEDFKEEIGRTDIESADGGVGEGKRLTVVNPRQRYRNGLLGSGDEDLTIVCEWQWWDRETVEIGPVPDPSNPEVVALKPLDGDQLKAAKASGQKTVKSTRKVFYRAFATSTEILFQEELPEGHFRYKAITGKRDRNKGTYYGLIKPMLDPQKFTNKLYSEILHIIRTNANGGMALEEDAVSDVRNFEKSWAATDKITWLKPGALSGTHGPKMQPKQPPAIQPALFQLMEFARDMVKACTGVNEEILGLASREQAGVLEQQRKQAAYGILSAFFDAKRRYQRENGRLLLAMMRLYLPDDTLVRIVADGEKKYVPIAMALKKGDVDREYDIIVDDAPAGPNTKAKVTAILLPMLPQLVEGGFIGAEEIADSIPFLDIPAAVAEKLSNAIRKRAQDAAANPPDPMADAELQNKNADTEEKKASAQGKQAKAFRDVTDAHAQHIGLGVEFLRATAPSPPAAGTAPGGPGGGAPPKPPGGSPASFAAAGGVSGQEPDETGPPGGPAAPLASNGPPGGPVNG